MNSENIITWNAPNIITIGLIATFMGGVIGLGMKFLANAMANSGG